MNKWSPVDMRNNLKAVEALKSSGIDFVAVPAKNEQHKNSLLAMANVVISEMLKEAGSNETN